MEAITEDYVSFETAKLLKEKGFDGACNRVYQGPNLKYTTIPISPLMSLGEFGGFHPKQLYVNNNELGDIAYTAPTLQIVMKWLREVHHIHTEICLYKTSENDVEPKKSRKAPYYTFRIWNSVTGDNIDKRLTNDFIADTYEEACEAAIKYCLENLI